MIHILYILQRDRAPPWGLAPRWAPMCRPTMFPATASAATLLSVEKEGPIRATKVASLAGIQSWLRQKGMRWEPALNPIVNTLVRGSQRWRETHTVSWVQHGEIPGEITYSSDNLLGITRYSRIIARILLSVLWYSRYSSKKYSSMLQRFKTCIFKEILPCFRNIFSIYWFIARTYS